MEVINHSKCVASISGTVFIHQLDLDGSFVAVKKYSRALSSQRADRILQEKAVLTRLTATLCPYTCSLIATTKDSDCLYFILSPVLGGPLHRHINIAREGHFESLQTIRYSAEIVSALLHFSHYGCIHRDLKASNVLLDSAGRIKVCDFGASKIMFESELTSDIIARGSVATAPKTRTFIGSLHCMAPEMVACREDKSHDGYTLLVDWWALGVLMFEMMAGSPPVFPAIEMLSLSSLSSPKSGSKDQSGSVGTNVIDAADEKGETASKGTSAKTALSRKSSGMMEEYEECTAMGNAGTQSGQLQFDALGNLIVASPKGGCLGASSGRGERSSSKAAADKEAEESASDARAAEGTEGGVCNNAGTGAWELVLTPHAARRFTSDQLAVDTLDFIRSLLEHDPIRRFGPWTLGNILNHPCFSTIDWESVKSGSSPPAVADFDRRVGFLELLEGNQQGAGGHSHSSKNSQCGGVDKDGGGDDVISDDQQKLFEGY